MNVKKIILLFFFLFGNFQIFLGLYYKSFSIGFIWYLINPNILVGFQRLLEKYSSFIYINKVGVNKLLIFFLDINIFFFLGFLFLLLPCFLSVKLTNS
ncbi:MAG: hypothetical protein CML36_01830 [Rhodobacteraceae bacterium]|nr:hypothetical protein [Paracoccaceae bacterium]OUU62463.1 MAG: hypothetical protein CBC22_04020 [Alphaproteobacteria bacterium TMED62]